MGESRNLKDKKVITHTEKEKEERREENREEKEKENLQKRRIRFYFFLSFEK